MVVVDKGRDDVEDCLRSLRWGECLDRIGHNLGGVDERTSSSACVCLENIFI